MASTSINGVKLTREDSIALRLQSAPPHHSPVKFTFDYDVQAMSSDEFPLSFSGSCTVGPRATSEDGPLNDKSISPSTDPKFSHNIQDLVKGGIVNEIHMFAASRTRKQIIFSSSSLKQAVFENVQLNLDDSDSDLIIHTANMRILVGITESEMKMEVGDVERNWLAHSKEDYNLAAKLHAMDEVNNCFPVNLPRLRDNINVADKNKRRERGISALMGRRTNVETEGNSDGGTVVDLENGGTVVDLENGVRRNVSHLLTAGASKDQLLRELWMLSRASLFVGVSAGVQQPSATGSVFAGHQAAYYSVVAAILAAVPVEMATAMWLHRSSSQRVRAFAKGLQSIGLVLLIIASAVGGCQLTIKA